MASRPDVRNQRRSLLKLAKHDSNPTLSARIWNLVRHFHRCASLLPRLAAGIPERVTGALPDIVVINSKSLDESVATIYM
jgi:hypothetical protein